jgi:hypothetical protein
MQSCAGEEAGLARSSASSNMGAGAKRGGRMSFLDRLWWRPTRVSDSAGLADFVDAHAAFVAQKGIYEYARARAGHYAKVLFSEPEFRRAVEEARWRAFPLGLAMVGEVAALVLEEKTELPRQAVVGEVSAVTLCVFDRYGMPAALDTAAWREARTRLTERLNRIGLHPPKRAIDIPEPFAEAYFALMPIHRNLRGQDFPTLKSYLKVTLCNVHHELTKRIDAQAIAADLAG